MIGYKGMRWAGNVARLGKKRITYIVVIEKHVNFQEGLDVVGRYNRPKI
jgi:hypothetical protein